MFQFENRIKVEDRPLLQEYLTAYKHRTSGLTFSSLYMWRDVNKFTYEIIDDYLCISGISNFEDCPDEPFIFPPLPRSGKYDPKKLHGVISELRRRYEKDGFHLILRLVPKHMLPVFEEAYPGKLKFLEDRPNYDYIYDVDKLSTLKGRAYHGKKNHLNYFKGNFSYEYVPLTKSMAKEALAFVKWLNQHKHVDGFDLKLLLLEERVLGEAFLRMEEIGIFGGALMVDGKMQGISVGSRLDDDTVVEHIEKANTAFRGLYQAVNNEFCINFCKDATYLNREEDMGLEGLRQSKLSYKPVEVLEKYIIVFQRDENELKQNGTI